MHAVESPYGPGSVILAAAAQPRFWEFSFCLDDLRWPVGSRFLPAKSCDVAGNFNRAIAKMPEGHQWAWFLGDDHQFAPNTLLRLLKHFERPDVDVVVPINVVKIPPCRPLVYHGPFRQDQMLLYSWPELSEPGLFPMPVGDFTGQAGMLVRTSVLERIGYPWFKTGQFDAGKLQEDLYFCRELQSLGYTIWIDRDIIFDHIYHYTVSAERNESGVYVPTLRAGGRKLRLDGAEGGAQPLEHVPPGARSALTPDRLAAIEALVGAA